MNVKKVITIALAVFLLCAVCCGAVSAFKVTSNAEVLPSGALVPGDHVSADVQIFLPKGSITPDNGGYLTLTTPLSGPAWEVTVSKGTENSGNPTPASVIDSTQSKMTIDALQLYYDSGLFLDIHLEGSVSASSAGKSISVLTINANTSESGGKTTYSSPEQVVISSGTLTEELAAVYLGIQVMDARAAAYSMWGWDVSGVQSIIEQARSQYSAAEASSLANPKNAYAMLDSAQNLLNQAEMKLAYDSLCMSLTYITRVSEIADELTEKGWRNEATMLRAENANLQSSYDRCNETYLSGTAPDVEKLDSLADSTQKLYNEALEYQAAAENPLGGILTYLPFILIGLGVIAIIIVIIVVIVKKRKNNWDELG